MSKLILFIVVIMAVSLVGASVVFAQDATQTTTTATNTEQICPLGGAGNGPADGTGNGPHGGTGNIEQMLQRHEARSGNVPAEMQEKHAAMGEALRSGDMEQVRALRATCQAERDAQQ